MLILKPGLILKQIMKLVLKLALKVPEKMLKDFEACTKAESTIGGAFCFGTICLFTYFFPI